MGEEVMMSMTEKETAAMNNPHFVLVHGIGGGAWCWYKIKCLMENSGYKVSCIDLKGAGTDRSDANSIVSFDDYNKPLMDFMSALPHTEQVILVGHSAGGLSVTQATHKFANKIRLAVYVAATMLKSGFLTDQDIKDGVPDLSQFGDVYELGFGLGAEQPPTTAMVKKEFQRKIIYQMSPQEDSTLAAMLLRPGPILALQSARFKEDGQMVEKVGRIYIKTMHDNVIKPEQQEAMIERWPPSQVHVLDSDHSPFFSAPFSFFGLLLKVAATSAGYK
ncbi:methylesterase 17-like [Gossypium australe]|uniref:Methylesterase 17-like n=1 Tax=Gossypium australe TaxID=47621 RepID=A0A5B6U9S9_9ROSI|nr:methylesterase 17-like [Gossypium australe]